MEWFPLYILSQSLAMYSPIQKSEEQAAEIREQAKEMREQTAQLADEVATLRETLKKLISKLDV